MYSAFLAVASPSICELGCESHASDDTYTHALCRVLYIRYYPADLTYGGGVYVHSDAQVHAEGAEHWFGLLVYTIPKNESSSLCLSFSRGYVRPAIPLVLFACLQSASGCCFAVNHHRHSSSIRPSTHPSISLFTYLFPGSPKQLNGIITNNYFFLLFIGGVPFKPTPPPLIADTHTHTHQNCRLLPRLVDMGSSVL